MGKTAKETIDELFQEKQANFTDALAGKFGPTIKKFTQGVQGAAQTIGQKISDTKPGQFIAQHPDVGDKMKSHALAMGIGGAAEGAVRGGMKAKKDGTSVIGGAVKGAIGNGVAGAAAGAGLGYASGKFTHSKAYGTLQQKMQDIKERMSNIQRGADAKQAAATDAALLAKLAVDEEEDAESAPDASPDAVFTVQTPEHPGEVQTQILTQTPDGSVQEQMRQTNHEEAQDLLRSVTQGTRSVLPDGLSNGKTKLRQKRADEMVDRFVEHLGNVDLPSDLTKEADAEITRVLGDTSPARNKRKNQIESPTPAEAKRESAITPMDLQEDQQVLQDVADAKA